MAVLVTGAAGFIGFHVAAALARAGERVLGVDNLSPYYDVRLKEARLAELRKSPSFGFERLDLAERGALGKLAAEHRDIDRDLFGAHTYQRNDKGKDAPFVHTDWAKQ